MGLLALLRKNFNQFICNLNCTLNGHTNVVELDRYETRTRARNFAGRSLEKLSRRKPYVEASFVRKCACRSCGRIFLETHTNTIGRL